MNSDAEIIRNPYVLYENTRRASNDVTIPVKKIDMAVYPPEEIRNTNPLQAPSALDSRNDKRRARAYAISILEYHALNGHTVYPVDQLIEDINDLPIEPACQVTSDIFNGFASFLAEELKEIDCTNGEKAYQLNR